MTSEQIEAIRNRASLTRYTEYPKFNKTANANLLINEDIPALLAEVERLKDGIATAIMETNCDDTWDFLNRLYNGKEPLNLSYRIGGKRNANEEIR